MMRTRMPGRLVGLVLAAASDGKRQDFQQAMEALNRYEKLVEDVERPEPQVFGVLLELNEQEKVRGVAGKGSRFEHGANLTKVLGAGLWGRPWT